MGDQTKEQQAHPVMARFFKAVEDLTAHTEQELQRKKSNEIPWDWVEYPTLQSCPEATTVPPSTQSDMVVQVCGRNELRYDVTVINQGSNPMVCFRNQTQNGVTLPANGGSFTWTHKAPIYAYSLAGTTFDVVEQVYSLQDFHGDPGASNRQAKPLPGSVFT